MIPSSRGPASSRGAPGLLPVLAWTFAVLLARPASAAIAASETDALTVRAGEQVLRATVADGALEGADVSLRWSPEVLEGHAGGELVSLAWARGRISGRIGEDAVRLRISQDVEAEEVDGWVGDRAVRLVVEPLSIRGWIGSCAFTLPWADTEYVGWVDCHREDVPVPLPAAIRVPQAFADAPDASRIAALVALMTDAVESWSGP